LTDSAEGPNPVGVSDRRQILLHLEASLIKHLKKAAVDLDTSASAIANEALDSWLRTRRLRRNDDKK
jgi:hypothetical protein